MSLTDRHVYQNPDFAPASTLFTFEGWTEEGDVCWAFRIAPAGTEIWRGEASAGQPDRRAMKMLMTSFLDERLQAAGLDATQGGYTAALRVYALHHKLNADHLNEPLQPMLQRWHRMLRDALNGMGVPDAAIGDLHLLTREQARLIEAPLVLADALATLDQPKSQPALPSLDAVVERMGQLVRGSMSRPSLLLRLATENDGVGWISFPREARSGDDGMSIPVGLDLSLAALAALHEVSDEHPGTVLWSAGQEPAALNVDRNVHALGVFQNTHVKTISVATLTAGHETTTLERLQTKLAGLTHGHTGVRWVSEADSPEARNLDVAVNEAHRRAMEPDAHGASGPKRKPGGL